MTDLLHKKCVPCALPTGRQEGGTPPLTHEGAEKLLKEIPGWNLHEEALPPLKISREFKFKNFKEAMTFVNRVAEIAEAEGHHPDISLHSWNRVRLEFYTHAIGGLSENDFIMAAKTNELVGSSL